MVIRHDDARIWDAMLGSGQVSKRNLGVPSPTRAIWPIPSPIHTLQVPNQRVLGHQLVQSLDSSHQAKPWRVVASYGSAMEKRSTPAPCSRSTDDSPGFS